MYKNFLSYAGNKEKYLQYILPHIPVDCEVYNEPFCGSCSALIGVLQTRPNHFKHIIVSDINKDLINMWNLVKTEPETFMNSISDFVSRYNAEDIESVVPKTDIEAICKFYVSACCNYYSKLGGSVSASKYLNLKYSGLQTRFRDILAISQLIQPVDFMCCSFEDSMETALSYNLKSFCFADPPYKEQKTRLTDWYDGNNFIDLAILHGLVSRFDAFTVSHSVDEVFDILFDGQIAHRIYIDKTGRKEVYACKGV